MVLWSERELDGVSVVCHNYAISYLEGYLVVSHIPSHCVGLPSCSSMMKYGLGLNSIPSTRVRT